MPGREGERHGGGDQHGASYRDPGSQAPEEAAVVRARGATGLRASGHDGGHTQASKQSRRNGIDDGGGHRGRAFDRGGRGDRRLRWPGDEEP